MDEKIRFKDLSFWLKLIVVYAFVWAVYRLVIGIAAVIVYFYGG